ncbi:class I SAM-dependent methyltransferase [Candidatus Microgenomates bacterium]|nr:class I SAM-dependent methyltransferase [Candidatus Microgenomates bacterium]
MDLEEMGQTVKTYRDSADALAAYYEGIGPRVEDIDRAMALWGDRLPVVLEIGCGAGRDAREIVKRTPYYWGIDISPRMIEIAYETVPYGYFEVGHLRYPPRNARFDIIFAFAALLHSDEEEVEMVLHRCGTIINAGGIFYISLKMGSGKIVQEDEFGTRTFYYYQPEDIERLAGDAFETVLVDTQRIGSTDWFTIALRKRDHAGTA